MAIDGIYSITFRGTADWGMGLLLLKDGVITGVDVAGVAFDGKFTEANDNIVTHLTLTVPPGVALVQGTPPMTETRTVPFVATIPKRALETHEPVLINMPVGPVNVIFRRLRPL